MEQSILQDMHIPARLKKVYLPLADRQEIIDYFAGKAIAYNRYSYEGSQIETIVHILKAVDDPIDNIVRLNRNHELYTEALEMLYAVRHKIEAKAIG